MANSEWRVANGEWRMVSGEWRTVFLEGSAPALPKNFRHLTTSDAVVANRQSPIAVVFGSAGISPSHFSRPSSRDPRPFESRRSFSASSTTD